MNIYIWESVNQATANYHSEGAVVVVAASETRARELANTHITIHYGDEEHLDTAINPKEKVDAVYALAVGMDHQEKVFIFPDAGCC